MQEYGSWDCLSIEMQQHGHTLDKTCQACLAKCIYSAPCGCASLTCIDLTIGPARCGVAAAA